MHNIMIIKLVDGIGGKVIITHYRVDQNYSEETIDPIVADIITKYHPSKTEEARAVCVAETFETNTAGKDIDTDVDIVNGEVVIS